MDKYYMQEALNIAKYATGRTSPNPLVGAVIVNNGRIVGQGWHQKAGTAHAEIHALKQAGELAKGATIYVTLEPCSHCGRTGPCADALIAAGIKKVVIAMRDPNPLVAGNGIHKLKQAGIEVQEDILADEAIKLNEIFLKWITAKMPFVALKTAMSLDGKIAAYTGHSQWITSPKAREYVHHLRDYYDAILVGIGTVLADNPELTTRLTPAGKNPIRIIVDSKARTPLSAKVVTDGKAPTIIAVTSDAPLEKREALLKSGVEVIEVAKKENTVDLTALFKVLATKEITSILVEGGATINASLLNARLVDKLYCFIAPKLIGGINAPGPIGGQGISNVNDAINLKGINYENVGNDILVTGYLD